MTFKLQHEFDDEPTHLCIDGQDEPTITFAPGNLALAREVLEYLNRYDEIKHRGYVRGRNCASWVDRPEIGSEHRMPDDARPRTIEDEDQADEFISAWAFSSEENDRCFSPFEFTAKEFNDRNDAEDCWEAYNEGIAEGIADEVKARRAALDAKREPFTGIVRKEGGAA